MQFAVHVTIPITNQLNSGNLFSEARWERAVVESLLRSPEVTDVYLTESVWQSPNPLPNKLHPSLPKEKEKDVVLIIPSSLGFKYKPKALVQSMYGYIPPFSTEPYFEGKNLLECFQEKQNELGEKLILVYPSDARAIPILLPGFESHYEYLQFPRLPYVSTEDNFNKKILIWPHKDTMDNLDRSVDGCKIIFEWICKELQKDSSLELHMLTGMSDSDIEFRKWGSIENRFWNHEASSPLVLVKNKVKLYTSMEWSKMLDIFSQAKLLLPSPNINVQMGGPPVEAAMFGIPFVGIRRSPLALAEHYINVEEYGSNEMFYYLNKLMIDHNFYNTVGNSYREYVNNNFTYDSWAKKLFSALKSRAII